MPNDSSQSQTSRRKDEHLVICRDQDTRSLSDAGWDQIRLPHRALPEIDYAHVSLETEFLGMKCRAPFLVSSMTGGSERGDLINESLARFSQQVGIPMGVGSQRAALEQRSSGPAELRRKAPRAMLLANVGAVQLNYGVTPDDCEWLVDQLEAQAFILHANPLQEAIQSEGDRNFSDLWSKIAHLKKRLKVPVILKETGCGLDALSCRRAVEAGVDALDIAGLGGSHWGYIEGLRHASRRELGELFRDWGIPSAQALVEARKILPPSFPVLASGGIQNGLHAAKALWLGAQMAGLAQAFLKKAFEGEKTLLDFFEVQSEALRIALFCMGAKTPQEVSPR